MVFCFPIASQNTGHSLQNVQILFLRKDLECFANDRLMQQTHPNQFWNYSVLFLIQAHPNPSGNWSEWLLSSLYIPNPLAEEVTTDQQFFKSNTCLISRCPTSLLTTTPVHSRCQSWTGRIPPIYFLSIDMEIANCWSKIAESKEKLKIRTGRIVSFLSKLPLTGQQSKRSHFAFK